MIGPESSKLFENLGSICYFAEFLANAKRDITKLLGFSMSKIAFGQMFGGITGMGMVKISIYPIYAFFPRFAPMLWCLLNFMLKLKMDLLSVLREKITVIVGHVYIKAPTQKHRLKSPAVTKNV